MTTTVLRFARTQTSWVNPLVIRFIYEPPPELPFDWGAIGLVTDVPYAGQIVQIDQVYAYGTAVIAIDVAYAWRIGSMQQINADAIWQHTGTRDIEHGMIWRDIATHERWCDVSYHDYGQRTSDVSVVWGGGSALETLPASTWSSGTDRNELALIVDLGIVPIVDVEFDAKYNSSTERREVGHNVSWGPHPSGWHCSTNYRPPKGKVTARFNGLVTPTLGTLTLRFTASPLVCDYDDGGGYIDGNTDLPNLDFDVPIEPQIKRLYLMQPTLSVTRVSDNTVIAVLGVTISDNRGQFSQSVSMEFATKADMLLAMNEPLKVSINGYDFFVVPEQSSYRRSFNSVQWSASGRGKVAEIAAPWKLPVNYSNSVDRSFAGMCGDILSGTGWTVELVGITDFNVPAKVFATTGKPPAEAINYMADSIGCMVIADNAANVLKIVPKFPTTPWSFGAATPAVAVHDAVIISYNSQDEINQLCNACWVRGEQQGVSRQIKRTGSAGNIATADISNALIVSDIPARLVGTAALAETGNKEKISIELPVMNDLPPLVKGMLIGVTFYTDTFKATCDSTSITATVNNDGSIDVSQSATLIRHVEL